MTACRTLPDVPERMVRAHAAALDRALDPSAYLGSADVFIDRALARHREVC